MSEPERTPATAMSAPASLAEAKAALLGVVVSLAATLSSRKFQILAGSVVLMYFAPRLGLDADAVLALAGLGVAGHTVSDVAHRGPSAPAADAAAPEAPEA